MSKLYLFRWVVLPLVVVSLIAQQAKVQAMHDALPAPAKGAIILYTVPPRTVCVGDTFSVEGGGFISLPDAPPASPGEIHVTVSSDLGSATPNNWSQPGNEIYFGFTSRAIREGNETIKVVENDGLAIDILQFKVEKACAFRSLLASVPDEAQP